MEIWEKLEVILHCQLLAYSYQNCIGRQLISENHSDEELAYIIYHGDFVLVSHDTQNDPVFNFANKKAQELWKFDWEKFTSMPSRLSAEPIAREERQKLLDEAAKKGFVENYKGIRIDAEGKRFFIENTTLWNVIDVNGKLKGQAALFSHYTYI